MLKNLDVLLTLICPLNDDQKAAIRVEQELLSGSELETKSPRLYALALFNLYAECKNEKCWTKEIEIGIKITRRDIISLRFVGDTLVDGRFKKSFIERERGANAFLLINIRKTITF